MFKPENQPKVENQEKAYSHDALLVLGAVMEWDSNQKKWVFPTIIPHYAGKLVMGKARAIAAREIQESVPTILVTGGSDEHPETGEKNSRSLELSRLMTDDLGIPAEKVVPMGTEGASHTLGNAENLVEYLKAHPEIVKTRRIAILCPRFQMERAKLMFDANPYFKENDIELDWIEVEETLEKRSPHYEKWVEAVYKTPEAGINREMEERGIEDLKSGKYKPKT